MLGCRQADTPYATDVFAIFHDVIDTIMRFR